MVDLSSSQTVTVHQRVSPIKMAMNHHESPPSQLSRPLIPRPLRAVRGVHHHLFGATAERPGLSLVSGWPAGHPAAQKIMAMAAMGN